MSAIPHITHARHPAALKAEVLALLRAGNAPNEIKDRTGVPIPTIKEWRAELKDDQLAACTVNSQAAAIFESDGVDLLKQAMKAAAVVLKRVAESGELAFTPKQLLELSKCAETNVATVKGILQAAAMAAQATGDGAVGTPSVSVNVSLHGVDRKPAVDLTVDPDETEAEAWERVDDVKLQTPEARYDELALARLNVIDQEAERAALEQDLFPAPGRAPIDEVEEAEEGED